MLWHDCAALQPITTKISQYKLTDKTKIDHQQFPVIDISIFVSSCSTSLLNY